MADADATRVSPDDINKIIEQAAKEPGINDMLALLRLSADLNQLEQLQCGWSEQPLIAQVSGTGGWIW